MSPVAAEYAMLRTAEYFEIGLITGIVGLIAYVGLALICTETEYFGIRELYHWITVDVYSSITQCFQDFINEISC